MKKALTVTVLMCMLLSCLTTEAAHAEQTSAPAFQPARDVSEKKDVPRKDAVELDKEYVTGYVSDFKSIVTAPARWETADWITAAAVTGVAVGLYDNDAKIQKWALDHRTTTSDKIGDDVTLAGSGVLTVPIVGGMYLYGSLFDDGKMRKTSLLSVESFVMTGIFVQTLKYTTGRSRPYTGDSPHTWNGLNASDTGPHMSFPSGHASSAFSIATVITSEYDNIIVPPLAYGIAAITAMTRVAHNAHWSSDVFTGSAIGYFTGKAVVASHRGGAGRLTLVPMVIGDNAGMGIRYKF